jgi:hypothetical protein
MVSHLWRPGRGCRPCQWRHQREVDVKASMIIWGLLALGGIALAIFATDSVANALGILLGLVGVIGFLLQAKKHLSG